MGTHGGPREGSGRKTGSGNRPKNDQALYDIDKSEYGTDPKKFLETVMADNLVDLRFRMDSAKYLLSHSTPKTKAPTKKEVDKENAKKATSKFAKTAPPKQ